MRIHIYNDEIRDRVDVTKKDSNRTTFIGIRFFVGDPIEHTRGDDDTSAVTFWFNSPHARGQLKTALQKALDLLDDPTTEC